MTRQDAMKTAGSMLQAKRAVIIALGLFTLTLCACTPKRDPDGLVAPEVIISPYAGARPLLAVAPLRNESGVSIVDTLRVSDAIAHRAAEVRDVACLPVNRTIAAMRAIGMSDVRTPEDARRLAAAVGADGIIVGSITAYDPYDPPKLGLTLGLYARDGSILLGKPRAAQSPVDIRTAPDEGRFAGSTFTNQPLSVVSELLDAKNHEVLMNVQRYAEGRHETTSGYGWKRYVKSMDLYTDFAAYWAVYRLMQAERLRLARDAGPTKPGTP